MLNWINWAYGAQGTPPPGSSWILGDLTSIQNGISEPIVFWHHVANFRFVTLFKYMFSMTYWFSIQYRSPDDDLGISIFTWYLFFFTSKSKFYGKCRLSYQEAVVENTKYSMEWYKNWRCGIWLSMRQPSTQ